MMIKLVHYALKLHWTAFVTVMWPLLLPRNETDASCLNLIKSLSFYKPYVDSNWKFMTRNYIDYRLLLKNSNLQDHRFYTYTDIQLFWLWTFRKKIGGRGRGTETRKCTRKLCGISKLAAEVSLSHEHTCTHARAHRCLWKLIHIDSDKFLSVSRIYQLKSNVVKSISVTCVFQREEMESQVERHGSHHLINWKRFSI